MELRAATEADASRLAEIARAAYGHYVERMGWEPRPMTEDYTEVMGRFEVTVAERDDAIAGFAVLGPDEEGFVLDNVAVDPSQQGSGVGRALLEHAEAVARRDNFDSIYLYTHEMMTENLDLYARIGYTEYRRRAVGPAEDSEVVFMRKVLA
jgi:ribosomal protein S18 acetylase RimI-like enzyme